MDTLVRRMGSEETINGYEKRNDVEGSLCEEDPIEEADRTLGKSLKGLPTHSQY